MINRKCIRSVPAIVFAISISFCLSAQNNVKLHEKALLLTDRELYICGEKIYFSAFTYDANSYLGISISSVLYAELYDSDNKVIARGKYIMSTGQATGYLQIPRTVKSGIFFLRAYTNYMRNFGEQQFALRTLRIINPLSTVILKKSDPAAGLPLCRIYPEGGRIVNGASNRIVCRFTVPDGENFPDSAVLADTDMNVLKVFPVSDDGFSMFSFTPSDGRRYFVESMLNGKRQTTELPVPKAPQVSLSVDSDRDSVTIKVYATGDGIFPLKLVAVHDNKRYFLTGSVIINTCCLRMPSIKMPRGLTILELMNDSGSIVASHAVYRQPYDEIRIDMHDDTADHAPGEVVKLNITMKDLSGLPVHSGFVMSAAIAADDMKTGKAGFQKNILLQELIPYFTDDIEIVNKAAENEDLLKMVLITMNCTDTASIMPSDKKFLPEMRGDMITGKALYKSGRAASGIRVRQSFTGTSSCVESCITDSDGKFSFITMNEKNGGDLILKAEGTDQETVLITDDEFSDRFPLHSNVKPWLSAEETELIKRMFINVQVEDAFRIADSAGSSEKKLLTPFYGDEYDEYEFSNYLRLPNMKEFAFEIILGVTTSKVNRQDIIDIIDKNTSRSIGPDPLILIDGVPVTDHSLALSIDPGKVKLVRVVRDKYFYKGQVFDGILDIITKKGDGTDITLPPGTSRQGFLHPESRSAESIKPLRGVIGDKVPEYRNLIYYDSRLKTNDSGMASFSFRAPDNTGIFKVRCFVMTQDGKAGEGIYVIKVK